MRAESACSGGEGGCESAGTRLPVDDLAAQGLPREGPVLQAGLGSRPSSVHLE